MSPKGPGAAPDTQGASPPEVQLQARSIDGIDLLGALVRLTPLSLVAVREQHPIRVDVPLYTAPLSQLKRKIIELSGMKLAERNGAEVVVSACRLPLSSEPDVAVEHDQRVSLFFNRIAPKEFFALMARTLELELAAPEGLPESDLALLVWARPTGETMGTVDSALSLETRVEGRRLVVRKLPRPRPCLTAGVETWLASLPPPAALDRSVDDLSRASSRQIATPCKRTTNPDEGTTGCAYLEHFALQELAVKGYIKLTAAGPYGAIVETPTGSFLEQIYVGDRLGERSGVVYEVDGQELQILERPSKAIASDTLTRISFQTGVSSTTTVSSEAAENARVLRSRREYLERYGLEELLISSAEEVRGAWQAVVIDPFGLHHTVRVHNYLGTNEGKITKISLTEVDLEEIVPDNLGGYMIRNTVLVPGVRYEEPRKALVRKYGAPVKATEVQSQFIDAARRGDIRLLQTLVGRGADLDAADGDGHYNALLAAIASGKVDAVAWLLTNGARANILAGKLAETPLHVAAFSGNLAIVRRLLEVGADVGLRDRHERTAIVQALIENHGDVVALLVAKGADLKSLDDIGLTPFTRAAYYGRTDEVMLFLRKGVTVADCDRSRYTLLSAAVLGGRKKLADTLIGLGADVNAISKSGESVLDLARGQKVDPAVIELLVSHGARSARDLQVGKLAVP